MIDNEKNRKTKLHYEVGLPLPKNQFVIGELIRYYNKVFGGMIGGNPFEHIHIIVWERIGNVPEIYGGNKIKKCYMSGISVFTVEGLDREDVKFVLQDETMLPQLEMPKKNAPQKRTELYYQLAGSRAKRPQQVLPTNWRQLGIRGSQLKRSKKRKTNKK